MSQYSETEVNVKATKSTSNINWTAKANTTVYGTSNNISFVAGDKISLNISQSPSGAGYIGYIGLRDNDAGTFSFASSSASTNGWNGTITVAYSGHFSLAIQNASSYSITYSGSYSY